MPELPDVVVYLEALERHSVGQPLERIEVADPFILRSVDPPPSAFQGQPVVAVKRLGKRIVLEVEGELFVVIHLMIAGRLRWRKSGTKLPKRNGLVAFDFPNGRLFLTEAGKKRRARMHLVRGREGLAEHDRGGLEILSASLQQFQDTLRSRNHTLRRALTDPRMFSGIGNAYSDEILQPASPL